MYALSVLLKRQSFLHSQNVSNDVAMENLADAVLQLHLEEPDTYQPSSPESDSPTSSSTDLSDNTPSENGSKVHRRIKLNEFLRCCNAPTIGPSKKRWVEKSVRTKKRSHCKSKEPGGGRT